MIGVFGLLLERRPFLRHFGLPLDHINEKMPHMTRNIQEFCREQWAMDWDNCIGSEKYVAFWFLLLQLFHFLLLNFCYRSTTNKLYMNPTRNPLHHYFRQVHGTFVSASIFPFLFNSIQKEPRNISKIRSTMDISIMCPTWCEALNRHKFDRYCVCKLKIFLWNSIKLTDNQHFFSFFSCSNHFLHSNHVTCSLHIIFCFFLFLPKKSNWFESRYYFYDLPI